MENIQDPTISLSLPVAFGADRHGLPPAATADCDLYLRRDRALGWDSGIRRGFLYRRALGPLPYRSRVARA